MLRRGALLFPFLILFAGATLIREVNSGLLTPAEEYWQSVLTRQPRPAVQSAVTLVEISDDTTLKHVWPWGADEFALFFHAALPFSPAVIAVEPVLDADRGALAGEDRDEIFEKMLHEGILRAPKLVLGASLGLAAEVSPTTIPPRMWVLPKVTGDASAVPVFTAVDASADDRFRGTTDPGWTNVPQPLGALGRCPLIFRFGGQFIPAISLQLAMLWEKVTPDEVEVVLGSHIIIGKKRIPIDEAGRMEVNFNASFSRLTYDDLLLVREEVDTGQKPSQPVETLTNRLLLLGRTDSFVRNLATPAGTKTSPSELFAAAVATIQTDAHPKRLPPWAPWAIVGVVALAALWLPRSKATRLAITVILAELLFIGAAVALYRTQGLILPGVLPLGLAVWVLILRAVAKKAHRVIAF
jgi:hypothetical protein